jgi:hypothetical protein
MKKSPPNEPVTIINSLARETDWEDGITTPRDISFEVTVHGPSALGGAASFRPEELFRFETVEVLGLSIIPLA